MSGDVTELPCPTCQRGSRETVGMVCQTCGRDYGPTTPAPGGRTRDAREEIARWLRATDWTCSDDAADDLIAACPAVADALAAVEQPEVWPLVRALDQAIDERDAALAAVERVEAIIERLHPDNHHWRDELRRALDGPT